MLEMRDVYSVLYPDFPITQIVQFNFGKAEYMRVVNHYNVRVFAELYTLQSDIVALFNIKYKNNEN